MAAPINTPLTREIWHLSIDDLFPPLSQTPRLGGPGPFVINLSASTAPISRPSKGIAASQSAHIYQIQRTEDHRMRYRLRLGPFASELEAEAVLEQVRDIYPSALTATAEADDLRAIASLQAKIDAQKLAAQKPPAAAPARSVPVLPVRLALAAAPMPRTTAPAAHAAGAAPTAPQPIPAAPAACDVEPLSTCLPSLETTQTVRPLTPLELEDHGAARWYVIQLSLAERAFEPDSLPNLDIFSVYRLYSVAGIDQGRVMHALRLGFFGEEIAASAVASYLAAYYEKPTIKRVSAAERERFVDQPLEARKDVGATGMHAVIEITSERVVRESRHTSVAVLPKSSSPIFGQRAAVRNSR
jgi:hypothetical protein